MPLGRIRRTFQLAGSGQSAAGARRTSGALRAVLGAVCTLLTLLFLTGSASALPTLALQSTFDGSATPAGSMTPSWLAVDEASGDVYVIDSAHDVVDVFSAGGTYLRQLRGLDTTARSFSFGNVDDDVAVDNSGGANAGNVYISSEGSGHVFAFDRNGTFLWQTTAGISDVCGVSVDPSGNPRLGDFNNGVQQLNPSDGSAVGSPIAATGDSCHHDWDSSGNLILNHWNGSIDKFDSTGAFQFHYLPGTVNHDVAVDRSSNDVYSAEGSDIRRWNAAGDTTDTIAPGTANAVAVNSSTTTGINSGSAPTVYVSAGSQVAIYAQVVQRTLTVTPAGSGTGTVTSNPAGIDCGSTCSAPFDQGRTVTLAATPDTHNAFSGWDVTGDPSTTCTGTTSPCTVTLNNDVDVRATFDPTPRLTLRATFAGSGGGHVTSNPAGIDCTATCTGQFYEGDLILLTAAASANSTFTGWSGGGCSGTGQCQVTMDAAKEVTATFAQNPPTASTGSASGVTQTGATVSGTVNPNGAATACTFEYGTSTSYGSSVPCGSSPGSGTSGVAVSAALSGLTAGTTYHFRVVARNAGGTANGSDQTFTTSSPPPTCATDPSLCPPPPRAGTIALAGPSTVTLKGTAVTVKLRCSGDTACSATVKLLAKLTSGKGKHKRTRTVTVASKTVTIAAGTTASVKLTLSKAARKVLATKHTLKTTLTAGSYRHPLVVKAPKRARKHHK